MSKEFEYVLFDLDGTLTDSGPGIMNGFRYAIQKMGGQVSENDDMRKFVGPPLEVSFEKLLGYSPEDTITAVKHYREYYNNMGGNTENSVYPGIPELLETLKNSGKRLIVATSKNEKPTNFVLDYFDLRKYFDFVSASNDTDRRRKADVIRYAVSECGINDLSSAVMVGDRENDVQAALEVGLESIGVLYGYGDEEELSKAGATYIVETPDDVCKLILG